MNYIRYVLWIYYINMFVFSFESYDGKKIVLNIYRIFLDCGLLELVEGSR